MSIEDSKASELERLREQVAKLENEIEADEREPWQATEYYATYHATTGFFLGIIGALASLMLNVIGSAVFKLFPLKIIQVYLTFPLGEKALDLDENSGIVLAVGCCLYIATGMLFGIPFQMILARYLDESTPTVRIAAGAVLGIALWLVNYYLILSWLQPLLFGGNWIVQQVPWHVGLLTHLTYGLTMGFVYPLGRYQPYKLQTHQ